MGHFDAVEPGIQRLPDLRDFKVSGAGKVRITSAKTLAGSRPDNARDLFMIVEGVNVDHPACAPGTAVKVFMCKVNDMYGPKNIGNFLLAACGEATPAMAERATGDEQALEGCLVGVRTGERVYGKKSAKAGQVFFGLDYFSTATTGPVAAAPPALVQAAPPAPATFPPAGWYLDPHGRGYYDANGNIKTEAELRA